MRKVRRGKVRDLGKVRRGKVRNLGKVRRGKVRRDGCREFRQIRRSIGNWEHSATGQCGQESSTKFIKPHVFLSGDIRVA